MALKSVLKITLNSGGTYTKLNFKSKTQCLERTRFDKIILGNSNHFLSTTHTSTVNYHNSPFCTA